jgi:hypothetical protein
MSPRPDSEGLQLQTIAESRLMLHGARLRALRRLGAESLHPSALIEKLHGAGPTDISSPESIQKQVAQAGVPLVQDPYIDLPRLASTAQYAPVSDLRKWDR